MPRTNRKPGKHQQFTFFKKRPRELTPKTDAVAKREWLKTHEITKLPPGFSQMGYGKP